MLIFLIGILIVSFASAEILPNPIQVKDVYNLGDKILIPEITIKVTSDVSGTFSMDLVCEGHVISDFYKNSGVDLSAGEEQEIKDIALILSKENIGELSGSCKIRGDFKEDYVLTNEFEISKLITLNLKEYPGEVSPEENLVIKGDAVKANSEDVNGFVEINFIESNGTLMSQLETIKNGFFSANITIPEDLMAGNYLVQFNAYEKDSNGEITNNGFNNVNVYVRQVPRNLEIVVENPDVEPGANLILKTILHDQTGQNIETNSIITLKNSHGKIIEQIEKNTDENYEFFIEKNELPGTWSVYAISNKLEADAEFAILEKADVEVELINDTITIKNAGNVFYNESVFVRIGDEEVEIATSLDVGEEQKYLLKAPDGKYSVEIIAEGETTTKEGVLLTGKAIDIKEGRSSKTFMGRPLVWIFMILILGFVAFMIFRKGIKKTFVGRFHFKKKEKIAPSGIVVKEKVKSSHTPLISPKNKAEVLLSIKGTKQDVSLVCLKLKNYKDILSGAGGVRETLGKIVDVDDKTFVYDNQENMFFILAPSITKTFGNEMPAIELAKKIDSVLKDHNRLFKQKIEYGISLNHGEIISKTEKNKMSFMSVGKTLTTAKKLSGISKEEIVLSPEINKRVGSKVKTKKHLHEDIEFYKITDIIDTSKNKTFIEGFLKRNFG